MKLKLLGHLILSFICFSADGCVLTSLSLAQEIVRIKSNWKYETNSSMIVMVCLNT